METAELQMSVIVAAQEGEEALAGCLEALAASDLPRRKWELVVVCPDHADTELLISARHADAIIRLPEGAWGASYGRNRGAEIARAGVLAFVNPDTWVAPDALSRILGVFDANDQVSAVCGMLVNDDDTRYVLSDYRALRDEFRCRLGAGRTDSFVPEFAAVRREAFLDAGMFDEWRIDIPRIEGAEVGLRLIALGHSIVLHSEIRALQRRRWKLRELLVSEIRDHGIPWEGRPHRGAIPVSPGLRALRLIEGVSISLVWCALVLAAIGLRTDVRAVWIAAIGCAATAALLSIPALLFLAQRRSILFVAIATPLYALELLLNGIGAAYSWSMRHTIGEPRPAPLIDALAEIGVETWPPVPTRRPVRAPSVQGSA